MQAQVPQGAFALGGIDAPVQCIHSPFVDHACRVISYNGSGRHAESLTHLVHFTVRGHNPDRL